MMPAEDKAIIKNMTITIGVLIATGIGLAIFAYFYGAHLS